MYKGEKLSIGKNASGFERTVLLSGPYWHEAVYSDVSPLITATTTRAGSERSNES